MKNKNMLPRGTKTRGGVRTHNRWEKQIADRLEAEGSEVMKRGWPDLIAVKGDEVRMIEDKPPGNRAGLSPNQRRMANILRKIGVDVELMRGEI